MAERIVLSASPPPGFVERLEATVFGDGAARFTRLGVHAQLARLADPTFMSVVDGRHILATYMTDRRRIRSGSDIVDAYYRGMLAVDSAHRGRGLGARLVATAMARFDAEAGAAGAPRLSFGCIELDNAASLATLGRSDARISATITTRLWYRQWPRARVPLSRLDGPDAEAAELCRDNTKRADRHDSRQGTHDLTTSPLPLFVLRDDAGVRVRARVAENALSLVGLGDPARRAMRWMGRRFPPFARRFDPDAFRYLRLSRLDVAPDAEAADFMAFVSTLMAEYRVHFVMTMLDPASPAARRQIDAARPYDGWRLDLAPHHIVTRWHPHDCGLALDPPVHLSPPEV